MRSAKSAEPRPNLTQGGRSGKKERRGAEEFLPGIVNGERVILYTPKEKKRRSELERVVQKRCMIALAAAGYFVRPHVTQACWRCHSPPVKQSGLGEGASDLFVMSRTKNGRACFIEIKLPKYSPSDVRPGQREFRRHVEAWGAVYDIATCEEEALAIAARVDS